MKYTVILKPQVEGGFTVRCLELPGAISQGDPGQKWLFCRRSSLIIGTSQLRAFA